MMVLVATSLPPTRREPSPLEGEVGGAAAGWGGAAAAARKSSRRVHLICVSPAAPPLPTLPHEGGGFAPWSWQVPRSDLASSGGLTR